MSKECPIHKTPHSLAKCRAFREKPLEDRKRMLKDLHICYKCCASTEHVAKDCTSSVRCSVCNSDKHIAALHQQAHVVQSSGAPSALYGGESTSTRSQDTVSYGTNNSVSAICTEICGAKQSLGKSCAKICLVRVYPRDRSELAQKVYALLDDQSNRSLLKSEVFERLHIQGEYTPYTIRTCSGLTHTQGRRARDLVVESLDTKVSLPLPVMIECNEIPDNRSEIPTPAVARHYSHLKAIAENIPDVDSEAPIALLLGRDLLQAHKVREQRNGPGNTPFAQRLDLGWVIVGDACLNGAHRPNQVNAYKTFVHHGGRTSYLQPCSNQFMCTEIPLECCQKELMVPNQSLDAIGQDVFRKTSSDNTRGLSVEDRKFLSTMDVEMVQNSSNYWVAPLPFRTPRPGLPNNKEIAYKRLVILQHSLSKNPVKKKHYLTFMEDLFFKGHAELAPCVTEQEESWYIPHFAMYHPRKPDKICVVFNSSCQEDGVSLNSMLLSGPDLTNSLIGVLLRFRQGEVGFVADIQQNVPLIICERVRSQLLRFLWFEDNDIERGISEYRMKVHLFGNSPSPAVTTLGLWKTAEIGEFKYGSDAKQFVLRNFYVDDGLGCASSVANAVDLLRRTQSMLGEANVRVHK